MPSLKAHVISRQTLRFFFGRLALDYEHWQCTSEYQLLLIVATQMWYIGSRCDSPTNKLRQLIQRLRRLLDFILYHNQYNRHDNLERHSLIFKQYVQTFQKN
jgi:hypothetical protein